MNDSGNCMDSYSKGKEAVRDSIQEGDPMESPSHEKILITVHVIQLTGGYKREEPFGFLVPTSRLLMFAFIISGNWKESRKYVKYIFLVKHKNPHHISSPFLEW